MRNEDSRETMRFDLEENKDLKVVFQGYSYRQKCQPRSSLYSYKLDYI